MKFYWVFCIDKKIYIFFLGGVVWYNTGILEIITLENCYKCDLEWINNPNNSQYFWINRRDNDL